MTPYHVRRYFDALRAERMQWEAAHPWRARYRRWSLPIRRLYWEIRFRLDVLIHGHECEP